LSGDGSVPHDVPPDEATRVWSKDQTSGKSVPATAAEWNDFIAAKQLGIMAPDGLWLMQEANGSLADSIGGVSLVPSGSASAMYRQAVSGWSRLAVAAADGSGVAFGNSLTTTLPIIGDTSLTVLALYELDTPPAAGLRSMLIAGCCAGYADISLDTNSHYVLSVGAAQSSGTLNHLGNVLPVILKLDHTSSRELIVVDKEVVSLPFTQPGSFRGLFLGAANHPTPGGKWLYMAAWYGPNAEIADAKLQALVTALGW
jgi:hypothetical protein